MPWGLVICIAIAIVAAIVVAYEEFYGFELGGTLVLTGLFSLLACLIWFLIAVISLVGASPVSQTLAEDQAIGIYSLADGNLTEGYTGSFLGRGYIDEELKYIIIK